MDSRSIQNRECAPVPTQSQRTDILGNARMASHSAKTCFPDENRSPYNSLSFLLFLLLFLLFFSSFSFLAFSFSMSLMACPRAAFLAARQAAFSASTSSEDSSFLGSDALQESPRDSYFHCVRQVIVSPWKNILSQCSSISVLHALLISINALQSADSSIGCSSASRSRGLPSISVRICCDSSIS